ncbi:MAG: guanylate kinase [Bacteroidia bacterium]|nr:guanylate kinase [Bacteroidia bacterium]
MPKDQKYIILSAPSGAGKTTIARHLLGAGLGLEFSITACSRSPRTGEKDGVDYYYLTAEEFRHKVAAGDFLEWEEVYPGHFYGTLKSEIDRIHQSGNSVLFDVDVVGGLNIKKIYKDKALAVFISPPSYETLKDRLEKRATDSPEKIRLRLAKAKIEMERAPEFDVIIVNDKLPEAMAESDDQVWFVISPLNPLKAGHDLLPDYHRRELVTRAIGDYPGFRVSSVEFRLPKPSYTIDTLSYLRREYPENQFVLIMGSDQLPDFYKWKNPEQILANHKILVYPRLEENRDAKCVTLDTEGCNADDTGFPRHLSRISRHDLLNHPSVELIVNAPMMEISSSFIRKSIKEGKDVRFFMPELTWQYLDEMHFYS